MKNTDNIPGAQDDMQYRINDLVDMDLLKDLFDKFTALTGFTIGVLDWPDMNILVQSGWKDICTKFHRTCPFSMENCNKSNRKLMEQLDQPGKMIIEKCENGLYDCATPIFIDGKHIASLATGQLLLGDPDYDFFRKHAQKCGFDETEYLDSLKHVKVVTEKEFMLATSFLAQIATFISESGFNNLKVKHETALLEREIDERTKTEEELRKSELKVRTVLALAPEAFFHGDPNGEFIDVNEAAVALTGYSREDLLNMNMMDLFQKEVLDVKPLRYDILDEGKTLTRQRLMLKKDGSQIIIEMSSRLMPDGTYQCFAKDITGNIKAQEALNESESRLRKFFECTQEGIVFHDKGQIEDVNKAHIEMLGYSAEQELIGRKIYDFISPETIETVKYHVENQLTEKYEAECVRVDGTVFPVEISPRVVKISDGRTMRIASVTDITERKKSENLEMVNIERTRALLQLSHMYNAPLAEIADFILEEAIKLTGSKIGYLAFLNEAEDLLTMHAWSKEALEECRISNSPREYPLQITGLWGEAVRQRKPMITNDYEADNPLKKGTPEGHVKIYRHLNVPVFDGDKIVAVIGVGNKKEEYYSECINQLTILGKAMWNHIDRQRALKELIESREQFRLITENSNDMIVTFDAESGVISYLSPGSGQIQKFESEEVVQKSFFDFCHPEDLPSILEAQKQIIAGKELPLIKHRIMMKDGSFEWFETSCRLVTGNDSEKVEVVAVCRDISEILKTEQMRKEKEAAEAASKAKSDFLANVSHEIRNPLNSIVGLANTLTRSNLSSDIQEIVNAIKISSGNLLNIINDVLDLSKIEANRIELANEDFEIRNVFSEVSSLFRSSAENKGLNFICEVDESVPEFLKGDMVRFRQMVVNLAGNAVKFTDKGSISIFAKAEKDNDRTTLITEVRDSGIGIKKEDYDKLFRSFSQLDSSTTKKYAGTGLGLAIVKSFADMMGGEISVDSEYGIGSTFTLKIPFMSVKKAADRSESDIDEQKNIGQCRVLLVEDDALNQMYLKGFLKSNGMIVDSAFNGLQALEKYEAGEYDIILMDGQMPKMDGFEATRIIREKEQESGKHTPVVAITGYAIKGDEERFINAGMDSYITKPFDENKLLEVIRKLTTGTR